VPLSKTGAELLFEMLSQRYERGSTLITSNLSFQEWTEVLGSERLTGALLDRLTHHVHILEMNGDSYRLKQSRRKRSSRLPEARPPERASGEKGLFRYAPEPLLPRKPYHVMPIDWPGFTPPLTIQAVAYIMSFPKTMDRDWRKGRRRRTEMRRLVSTVRNR